VANLWDVTDKDIDRFTQATLLKAGLMGSSDVVVDVARAVAEARTACTLGYANGAAPVVFGLPAGVTGY
jgi:separase